MSKGMINHLPEALILHILFSLPTKTVVTTSVLSKQWRSLYKSVPKLKLDSSDYRHKDKTFSEVVCKYLLTHKSQALHTFHLKFGFDKVTPLDLGLWIGTAFSRHLRELVLEFLPMEETFVFPSSLCSCNTLETLKLNDMILVDISTPVYMKSLRTLHLVFVTYKGDESVCNLLSGCPVLEELVVYRGEEGDVETFFIDVPTLKRLTVYDDKEDGLRGYMLNVPSLKYLEIEALRCPKFCMYAPALVEAEISNVAYTRSESFLGSFALVRRLSLDLSPLKFKQPIGCMFYQLVCLEIGTHLDEWWNLVMPVLEVSPKLQVLKLVDRYLNFNKDGRLGKKWNRPKRVPECLLSTLEKFVWARYDWVREEEKEVATYILMNARLLKNATFSTKLVQSEEVKKLEERRKVLDELNGVVKASDSCKLVFEFDSSNYLSEDEDSF